MVDVDRDANITDAVESVMTKMIKMISNACDRYNTSCTMLMHHKFAS